MAEIRIENVSFAYEGEEKEVFSGLSLRFSALDNVGLIGPNGKGKTTLLRLLQGKEEPTRGKIILPMKTVSFPQEIADPTLPGFAVVSRLAQGAERWEIERELSLLGLDPSLCELPFSRWSSGEKAKGMLAALFLEGGAYPLIDEATNHLDWRARREVAAYLKRQRGFLLVSHDRRFLDEAIDHVLGLAKGEVIYVPGNASSYLAHLARQDEAAKKKEASLGKEIRALMEARRKAVNWARKAEGEKYGGGSVDRGYLGHKAAKMMKRAKAHERRVERDLREKEALLRQKEERAALRASPLAFRGKRLLQCAGFSPTADGTPVCEPLDLVLENGERVALIGDNGSGKSHVLRGIFDRAQPRRGEIFLAPGASLSYLAQDGEGESEEPWEGDGSDEEFARFSGLLTRLGFPKEDWGKPLSALSDGERKKVALARCLARSSALYLLDEPLNFLDMDAREQIAHWIEEAQPTLLFAEHDEAFLSRVASRRVEIRKAKKATP